MNWTQAICLPCYERGYPGRIPLKAMQPQTEWCCECGRETKDGIYVRRNPRTRPPGHHRQLATECWRMIRALSSPDVGTPMALKRAEDLDAAAIWLIEMACDSAAESQRIADGHPPKGTA